jgi:hypothetical protein
MSSQGKENFSTDKAVIVYLGILPNSKNCLKIRGAVRK